MSVHKSPRSSEQVQDAIEDLKIKSESSDEEQATITLQRPPNLTTPTKSESSASEDDIHVKHMLKTNMKKSRTRDASQTPQTDPTIPHEELVGGEVIVKEEPGKPLKLARNSSQKVMAKPAPLYDHLPDATTEATEHFEVIRDNIYSNKHIGRTDDEGYECECDENWDSAAGINRACADNCINRLMRVECAQGCRCGPYCQNQRFQQRQYADVSVISTDKKGFGLRINTDLDVDDFIFEYLGEVIPDGPFQRRRRNYDEEGIKHFYFMQLNKGEFLDATKKGNLGRFCNHSCNPNCYVDKWNVGDTIRMGIFAKRAVKAGEELTFNYNVDRYGADAQPCYCGEANCVGFIGGKTQTGGTNQLSYATIEALGIDDGDGWDAAVSKKPRKRKTEEDDEEYINNVEPKPLAEEGVAKVMAALKQTGEKWIAVKLLNRIERAHDSRVIHYVVKMHGYPTLKTALSKFKDDRNIVLQIFSILTLFPRLTRNKIEKSHIEETVRMFETDDDENVQSRAKSLLEEWGNLETGYRIKRRDPTEAPIKNQFDRREERGRRSRSRSPVKERSKSPPRGPAAPTGPKSNVPQRQTGFYSANRPFPRSRGPFGVLPAGWFRAVSNDGKPYYYNTSGTTTWEWPTAPASQPPPPPKPKAEDPTKHLDNIINQITKQQEQERKEQKTQLEANAAAAAAAAAVKAGKDHEPSDGRREGKDKDWRKYTVEKQKKIYENTMHSVVKTVAVKYRSKLANDDYKKLFSQLNKKLVESDYKNGRVSNPTKIDDKKQREIKKYTQGFFAKAVDKKRDHGKEKEERGSKKGLEQATGQEDTDSITGPYSKVDSNGGLVSITNGATSKQASVTSLTPATPAESGDLKHKRHSNGIDESGTPTKRVRSETPPSPPSALRASVASNSSGDQSPNSLPAELMPISTGIPPPPPPPPPSAPMNANSTDISPSEPNSMKRKRDEYNDEIGNEHKSPTKRARSITPPFQAPPSPCPPINGESHSGNSFARVYPESDKFPSSTGLTHLEAQNSEDTTPQTPVEAGDENSALDGLHLNSVKYVEA